MIFYASYKSDRSFQVAVKLLLFFFLCGAPCITIKAAGAGTPSGGNAADINVEGKPVGVQEIDGVKYVSLKSFSKALKLSVSYSENTKMYNIKEKSGARDVKFAVGKRAAIAGASYVKSASPVIEVDGDVKVPVEMLEGLYNVKRSPKKNGADKKKKEEAAKNGEKSGVKEPKDGQAKTTEEVKIKKPAGKTSEVSLKSGDGQAKKKPGEGENAVKKEPEKNAADKKKDETVKNAKEEAAQNAVITEDAGADGVTAKSSENSGGSDAYVIQASSEEIRRHNYVKVNIKNEKELSRGIENMNFVVAIDAGHGGEEFGAVSFEKHLIEKDISLDIARRLKVIMDKTRLKGLLIRIGDYFIPYDHRINAVNSYGAKLLISIHCGGASNPSACGTGVYYYGLGESERTGVAFPRYFEPVSNSAYLPASKSIEGQVAEILNSMDASKRTMDSKRLAECIDEALKRNAMFKVRPMREARLAMFSDCAVPGVIVEAGFLSNSDDEKSLMSNEFKDQIALAIFDGIKKYLMKNNVKN